MFDTGIAVTENGSNGHPNTEIEATMSTNDDAPREAILHTYTTGDGHDRRPLSVVQLERLHTNLHPARVASRTGGGGNTLSYLEAYDVKATLIRIFGYGNFSVEVLDTKVVHTSQYPSNGKDLWRIAATATVRLTIHQTGAVYTETAAASQSGPDIGEVMDFAIKTAESDALKRCAIYLGTTFGLSLYNNGSTRDVVGRVFAPDQYDVVEALRVAGNQDAPDEARSAARAVLQARFKTHTPLDEPAPEGPQEPAEAPQEPVDAPAGRKAPARRRTAAQPAPDEAVPA